MNHSYVYLAFYKIIRAAGIDLKFQENLLLIYKT